MQQHHTIKPYDDASAEDERRPAPTVRILSPFAIVMVLLLFVCCLAQAAITGHLYMKGADLTERLAHSEANTRYHHGVATKLEQEQREEMEKVENLHNMTVWQMQGDLEACRKQTR